MGFSGPPIGGLPESTLRGPPWPDIVALSPQLTLFLPSDQNRAAKRMKDRAKERALKESLMTNSIKGTQKGRQVATTSTTPPARHSFIFSATPGPLPSIYGTILSGGRS